MEIEKSALLDFLTQTPPLNELPQEEIKNWLANVEIEYFRQGETILEAGTQNSWVFLVRSGAVQVLIPQGEQVNAAAEGEWFGYRSLLQAGQVEFHVVALEDSLVYRFPSTLFLQAYQQYAIFQQFFSQDKSQRIRLALQQWQQSQTHLPLDQPIQKFVRPIEMLSVECTLQQVAKKLQQAEKDPHAPWPVLALNERASLAEGLVQMDARLILQAVARGVEKLHQLLPFKPHYFMQRVSAKSKVGEVLPQLVKRDAVLVGSEDGSQILGIFSLNQLPPALDFSALNRQVKQAQSFESLQPVAQALPAYFQQLVMQKLPAIKVGRLMSALGEALTQKVVWLALQQLKESYPGLEDLSCAFMVTGSMARGEQTLKTDQDNAMLLPDQQLPLSSESLGVFAQTIVDQLNELGYAYCPGNIMASNPKWRQPVQQWQRYFKQWTEIPEAESILMAATFYDLKPVCGANELFDPLQQQALELAKNSALFLHHLAENALRFRPPIGFFRNFILETLEQKHSTSRVSGLDLKKRGITPIVELARVYALSEGISALNTWDRLDQAQQAGAISQQGYEDLRDALDLIAQIRQQHQAHRIEQNLPADNMVSPQELSHLEQRHLKDAFTVVREMQEAVALQFNL